MLNDLIQMRDLKATEQTAKKAELTRLESELAIIEDRQHQVQGIETALKEYYAGLYKGHPIDRSQEKEISETIKEKQAAINKAKSKRTSDIKKAERYHPLYSDRKGRESEIKVANKVYVDELKRIFGEMEIDIKKYHKKGISKIDLIDLINIMDSICASGLIVGSIPLSYQKKVYKWKQAAKELPDDEERINNELEEEAKQKYADNIKTQKLQLTEIRRKIKSSLQCCTILQNDLDNNYAMQVTLEQEYPDKKKKIEDETLKRKEKAQAAFDMECQDSIVRCAKRKEEIRTQLANLQISIEGAEQTVTELKREQLALASSYDDIQKQYQDKVHAVQNIIATNRKEYERLKGKRKKISDSYELIKNDFNKKVHSAQDEIDKESIIIEQLKAEKNNAEEILAKSFILSFSKKRNLKEKVAGINLRISEEEQTIQELEARLTVLYNEDPDLDASHPLKNQMNDIDAMISGLENELQSQETLMSTLSEEDPDQDRSHPLRLRSDEIRSQVDSYYKSIDLYRKSISSLLEENPERESEKVLLECNERFLQKLDEIEKDLASQTDYLEQERVQMEESIQKQKEQLEKEKKNQKALQEKLKAKEDAVHEAERWLSDFHAYYLIQKYTKKFGINNQIMLKKEEIKKVSSEAKRLSKEVADLDKKIAIAEKEQMRQIKEDKKQQMKKAKEEEKNRKAQEKRQQRIIQELKERDLEQAKIQGNNIILHRLKTFVQELEEDNACVLFDDNKCPLQDDGKRVITNGIVRKQYIQTEDQFSCGLYALVFVDRIGNAISEMRLIERKTKGAKTKTSFELKSKNGFIDDNECFLLILNFETTELICAQKYKINISFSNDFDF